MVNFTPWIFRAMTNDGVMRHIWFDADDSNQRRLYATTRICLPIVYFWRHIKFAQCSKFINATDAIPSAWLFGCVQPINQHFWLPIEWPVVILSTICQICMCGFYVLTSETFTNYCHVKLRIGEIWQRRFCRTKMNKKWNTKMVTIFASNW